MFIINALCLKFVLRVGHMTTAERHYGSKQRQNDVNPRHGSTGAKWLVIFIVYALFDIFLCSYSAAMLTCWDVNIYVCVFCISL